MTIWKFSKKCYGAWRLHDYTEDVTKARNIERGLISRYGRENTRIEVVYFDEWETLE